MSSEAEELILVDAADRAIGHASKARCHDGDGLLHRAFSVFLFNDRGELLLQQRSPAKRLWPGYWSNSCCSHPRRGESLGDATRRRLMDELDIDTPLEFVYKFSYQAKFGVLGSEHELCHVFLGRARGDFRPNRHEISAVRFLAPDALAAEFEAAPDSFTPWFRMEWRALSEQYRDHLSRYSDPSD